VLRERLAPVQLAGVVLLVAGVWLARPPVGARRGLPLGVVAGGVVGGDTAPGSGGGRRGAVWLFFWGGFAFSGAWVGSGAVGGGGFGVGWGGVVGVRAVWLLPWAWGARGELGTAVPVGVLTVGAYGLTLAALSLAPLALVAPLRESGVIVVALWGVFRLGER